MQIEQVSNQLKVLTSEKHLIELAKVSEFQVRHRSLLDRFFIQDCIQKLVLSTKL